MQYAGKVQQRYSLTTVAFQCFRTFGKIPIIVCRSQREDDPAGEGQAEIMREANERLQALDLVARIVDLQQRNSAACERAYRAAQFFERRRSIAKQIPARQRNRGRRVHETLGGKTNSLP